MQILRQISIRLALTFKVFILFVLVFVSTFALYTYTRTQSAPVAFAATSSTLNFQGRLLTSSGDIVPDGVYNLEFKLYDGGTQGGPAGVGEPNTGSLLWTETRDFPGTDDRVRVVNGYFSVNLGSVTAFPGTINWDQELWLTMNVGGSSTTPAWDGEMLAPGSKRTKLTGVPYAFKAGSARQLLDMQGSFTGVLDFLALSANRNIDLPDADGTVLLDSTGFANGGNSFGGTATLGTNDANDLILETGGVEGLRIDQDGDVGIGTLADAVESLEVNGGIKLGNTSNTNAGTIRWTGTDFEGYDGASWVSLTSGGGGTTILGTSSATFISAAANLPGTATGTATGILSATSAAAVAFNTGSNTYVAPTDGSFRTCTVITNANRTAGTVTMRWSINGVSTGTGVCVIDGTNIRTSSSSIANGTVSFSAGDTLSVVFDSVGFTPTNTEFTAYWTVDYEEPGGGTLYEQDGNSFGATATLGTNDNFGLNFETNGTTRFSIDNSGASTFNSSVAINSGGLSVTGGIDNNSGGITETGSITGVGANITATAGLTIATTGAGDLTLDSAGGDIIIDANNLQRVGTGTTTIDLLDTANTTLSITNSDGTAVAGLSVEGAISATSFSGSGSGLTSLNGSEISTGTIDDARLSVNVALLDADQAFTGEVSFDQGLTLGNNTGTTAGTLRWTGSDFEGYDGASWVSLTGAGGGLSSPSQTSVTKTANECVNNTGTGGCASSGSTLQNDNHLAFPIGANETWTFRYVLQANSSVAAGFKFAVTAPSGSTCVIGVTDSEGASSSSNLGCGVSSGLIAGSGSDEVYEVVGSVTTAGTAGNVTLQWAQNTSDASNTTVYAGSYLTAYIDGGGLTILQGGNAFGATAVIGTADNQALRFITNNTQALLISNTGDASFDFDVNIAGALNVTAGGAVIVGGIDNSSDGITNAGALTGVTTVDASGNVTVGGSLLTNTIDRSAAGALTIGNTTATSIEICNGANCDTISIGTNADADTINIGDVSDAINIIGGTGVIDFTNFDVASSGAVSLTGNLSLSGDANEGISGGGLTDCDGTYSKLQWDSTTNKFSCGTDLAQMIANSDASNTTWADNDTTELWNGTKPSITIGAGSEVLVMANFIATGDPTNNNVQLSARLDREGNGVTSVCSSTDTVGPVFSGSYTDNANGDPASRIFGQASFVDSPGAAGTYTYAFCTSADTVIGGGTWTETRVEIILYEINDAGDLAEIYPTNDSTISAGEVVSLDETGRNLVSRTAKAYDNKAIGIVATKPGLIIGGRDGEGVTGKPVALSGRVPVKVTTINGSIKKGDLITSSNIPGVAMKATKSGAVLGVAMTDYSGEGIGEVMVFVQSGQSSGQVDSEKSGSEILAEIMSGRQDLLNNPASIASISTDRLAVGLELIAPQITTDNIDTNNINVTGTITAQNLRILGDNGLDYGTQLANLEARLNSLQTQLNEQTLQALDLNNIEVGGLIVNEEAIFNNLAIFKSNTQFESEVNVLGYTNVQGLTVNLDMIAKGAIVVEGKATFKELVRFEKDVEFGANVSIKGDIKLGSENSGKATINKGENKVVVTFAKPKQSIPILTLSVSNGKFAQYSYQNLTKEGFEIILPNSATEDLEFAWITLQTSEVETAVEP